MRRLQVVVPLVFGLAISTSARQHFAAPATAPVVMAHPVAAAPVGAVRAAPMHAVPSGHPVTHAPVAGVRPVTTAHKRPVSASIGQSHASNLALGTGVNAARGVPLPSKCNHFGYPLQGLNGCGYGNGVVLPLYGGGMYIPIPYYVDTSAQEQPAPEGQEQASSQQPDNGAEQQPAEQEPAVAGEPSRAPSNNINESLAQFVFVQRDGTKFYAVAYSFLSDKLHYVTKEGVRHSVPVDSLDFDATQKFNEDLGNTINLPNLPASGIAMNMTAAPLH
jgi:hypothetical protein